MRSFLLFFIFCCSVLYSQENMIIATTEYPPYQFMKNGQIDGVSAAITSAIFNKAGIKHQIYILPWARAEIYLESKEIFFFSLSRTIERENKYQWISAITPNRPFLWKLKKRNDIVIKNFKDLKSMKFGVLPNDVYEKYLTEKGIDQNQFQRVTINEQSIRMLIYERIDLIPCDETTFFYLINKLGYKIELFERAYMLNELNDDAYLVASLSVPISIIKKLQAAWAILLNDNTINIIRLNYSK